MRVCSSVLDDPSTHLVIYCWVCLCALKKKCSSDMALLFFIATELFKVLLIGNINKCYPNLQSTYNTHFIALAIVT